MLPLDQPKSSPKYLYFEPWLHSPWKSRGHSCSCQDRLLHYWSVAVDHRQGVRIRSEAPLWGPFCWLASWHLSITPVITSPHNIYWSHLLSLAATRLSPLASTTFNFLILFVKYIVDFIIFFHLKSSEQSGTTSRTANVTIKVQIAWLCVVVKKVEKVNKYVKSMLSIPTTYKIRAPQHNDHLN